MATLKQFLLTGELGPIHHGMSEEKAISFLGAPQDTSVERNPRILKYGGLQLTFFKRPAASHAELTHVGLYYAPRAEALPEPTRPDDFHISCDTTIAEIREFLAQNELSFHLDVEDKDANYVILSSGARIAFDAEKLQSIHFALPSASQAKKQISISIPQEICADLEALARKAEKSVSALCAEWIAERANELNETEDLDRALAN